MRNTYISNGPNFINSEMTAASSLNLTKNNKFKYKLPSQTNDTINSEIKDTLK
jgi:hypothetical protein